MTRLSEDAWGRYTSRSAAAGRALFNDPLYAAQMSQMRQLLDLTDMVLEDNGITEDVRRQVANQLLYGCPNPYDAEVRVERHREKVEELARMAPALLPKGWWT